jgi:GxxExxY protein
VVLCVLCVLRFLNRPPSAYGLVNGLEGYPQKRLPLPVILITDLFVTTLLLLVMRPTRALQWPQRGQRDPSTPNQLTEKIIGAAIKIHRTLGPGLLESAYQTCMAFELKEMGLRAERQKPVPLIYNAVKLECGFRADLLVDGRIVVELKSKEVLHPVDYAQLLSHLRLLGLQVGLLINFHVVVLRDGIKRIVNNYEEDPGTQRALREPAEDAEEI